MAPSFGRARPPARQEPLEDLEKESSNSSRLEGLNDLRSSSQALFKPFQLTFSSASLLGKRTLGFLRAED